ncbi:ATP-binding protein [Streptomyces sp. NPDC102467]|uniref:ATP-binding protein n=1 Tax=Streptomyces sp. NPDC102467 TaxID=3366179 RepID=UPI0038028370
MTAPDLGDQSATPVLECPFTQGDLPRLRMLIDRYADREGLSEPRRGDFIVAIDAVATNAIEYAGGGGTLTLQRANGHLECHIHDSGPGFTADVIPPQAPRIDDRSGGSGLWIAALITDQLTISSNTKGAIVALVMRLSHASSGAPQ